MDPHTDLYLKYYTAQVGGSLPFYSGTRRVQYGSGLGDILRGIARTVLPILLRGAGTFLGETIKAKDSGVNWKRAALSALKPTASELASNVSDRITTAVDAAQKGSGRLKHNLRRSGRVKRVRTGKAYKRKRTQKKTKKSGEKRIKFVNF